eukprot:9541262-Alexandrium_andersonii.AAC.1
MVVGLKQDTAGRPGDGRHGTLAGKTNRDTEKVNLAGAHRLEASVDASGGGVKRVERTKTMLPHEGDKPLPTLV